MKINKALIAFISGSIMMIIGIILNIVASFKEFGFWSMISRPSITEAKLLFTNQAEYIIPGIILIITGYVIMSITMRK